VKLYVLESGLIECEDYAMFSPVAGPGVRQDLSVRSYLVVHPEGTLLFDTGIEDAIAEEPDGRRVADPIVFRVPRRLRDQLGELGVTPGDVANEATVLLQAAEAEAGFGPDAERLTLIPETYAALDRGKVRTVYGDHDVFGDGSVTLIALPGHTPGHQGLLVRLPETGPVLLATDITYSADDYAAGVIRESNVDLDQTRASIEKAQRIEREEGATVWLHHDLEAQRAVRTAPEFYV
jgi:glyoxylase-like metal-dependent hydrolase (beta-lactamase superfamily II)